MVTSYICNYACTDIGGYPILMVTYNNTQNAIPIVVLHGIIHAAYSALPIYRNATLTVIFDAKQSRTFPFYVGGLEAGLYSLSGTSTIDFQVLQNGSLFVGQQMDWSLVKPPSLTAIGMRATQADYRNSLNFTVTGVVWLTIHNSIGQTVSYSTATLNLPAGGDGTAYNIIFGLPPGTYNATLFVTSVSFVALSNSTFFTFTIPSTG